MREIVGTLTWLAANTRPDISYATNMLARHLNDPNEHYARGAKRLLRYLKKTRLYGLELRPTKGLESLDEVFADADWAGDKTSRRSTTGTVVTIGGCPTQWMSKRQGVVALSTMEAEYIAASLATQEAMSIRQLLIELRLKPVGEPTRLWCDNQSAIANMQNEATKSRSKHMDIRYHILRARCSPRQQDKGGLLPNWTHASRHFHEGAGH
ncbi:hypothetical protein Ae201684P_005716 [Aphanomyces euteiches]|nr:hypothetical protein Ae201684P_005716 [Aphanomyces euteiches]